MMVPLKLELLNERLFLEEMEIAFAELQNQMMTYARKYGKEAISKESKLQIEVKMKYLSTDLDDFVITTNHKKVMPQPPAIVTRGIGDAGKDGELTLFVKEDTGSRHDTPRQATIPMEPSKDEK